MQIPDPLPSPKRPAYHPQATVDYDEDDAASESSFKKPKKPKEDYKPPALRWPLLVSQLLLLLLCISLIVSALILMPNTDTSAVLLPATDSEIEEGRRREKGAAEGGGDVVAAILVDEKEEEEVVETSPPLVVLADETTKGSQGEAPVETKEVVTTQEVDIAPTTTAEKVETTKEAAAPAEPETMKQPEPIQPETTSIPEPVNSETTSTVEEARPTTVETKPPTIEEPPPLPTTTAETKETPSPESEPTPTVEQPKDIPEDTTSPVEATTQQEQEPTTRETGDRTSEQTKAAEAPTMTVEEEDIVTPEAQPQPTPDEEEETTSVEQTTSTAETKPEESAQSIDEPTTVISQQNVSTTSIVEESTALPTEKQDTAIVMPSVDADESTITVKVPTATPNDEEDTTILKPTSKDKMTFEEDSQVFTTEESNPETTTKLEVEATSLEEPDRTRRPGKSDQTTKVDEPEPTASPVEPEPATIPEEPETTTTRQDEPEWTREPEGPKTTSKGTKRPDNGPPAPSEDPTDVWTNPSPETTSQVPEETPASPQESQDEYTTTREHTTHVSTQRPPQDEIPDETTTKQREGEDDGPTRDRTIQQTPAWTDKTSKEESPTPTPEPADPIVVGGDTSEPQNTWVTPTTAADQPTEDDFSPDRTTRQPPAWTDENTKDQRPTSTLKNEDTIVVGGDTSQPKNTWVPPTTAVDEPTPTTIQDPNSTALDYTKDSETPPQGDTPTMPSNPDQRTTVSYPQPNEPVTIQTTQPTLWRTNKGDKETQPTKPIDEQTLQTDPVPNDPTPIYTPEETPVVAAPPPTSNTNVIEPSEETTKNPATTDKTNDPQYTQTTKDPQTLPTNFVPNDPAQPYTSKDTPGVVTPPSSNTDVVKPSKTTKKYTHPTNEPHDPQTTNPKDQSDPTPPLTQTAQKPETPVVVTTILKDTTTKATKTHKPSPPDDNDTDPSNETVSPEEEHTENVVIIRPVKGTTNSHGTKPTSTRPSSNDDDDEDDHDHDKYRPPTEEEGPTMVLAKLETTVVTTLPPSTRIIVVSGLITTSIATASPESYTLTYTTALPAASLSALDKDNTRASEAGEYVTVTSLVTSRVGGSVTTATETRPPFTTILAEEGELKTFVMVPVGEVTVLDVGGTPTIFTTSFKSFRAALATGTPDGGGFNSDTDNLNNNDEEQEDITVFTTTDIFLGSFLPLLLAVLLSIISRIIDLTAKMYQPFNALAADGGAAAKDTINLSFFETLRCCFSAIPIAFRGYPVPIMTTFLAAASWVLVPLASEAISVKVHGECEQGVLSTETCRPDLGVTPRFGHALLGVITAMTVVMFLLVLVLRKWRTGLAFNPWSIANMSLLALSPEFRAPLIALARGGEAGKLGTRKLRKMYGDRWYKLGTFVDGDGDSHYAIVPADDSAMGLTVTGDVHSPSLGNGTNSPPTKGLTLLNGASRVKTNIPFVPLKLWARVLATVGHVGVLAMVAYYQGVDVPYENELEVLLDSPSVGSRLVFAGVGVTISFWWFYFFISVATILPYHLMSLSPRPPTQSILLPRLTNPFTALPNAVRTRNIFFISTTLIAIISELLPILLPNIPFRHVSTFASVSLCARLSLCILSLQLCVLLASLFVKWPHMPADPRSIAGATYYIAESTMLALFEGLADVSEKDRVRRIHELGRRFGYGDYVSTSGRRRFGVDADSGIVGEFVEMQGDRVIDIVFSHEGGESPETVEGGSGNDGLGQMSGALTMSSGLGSGCGNLTVSGTGSGSGGSGGSSQRTGGDPNMQQIYPQHEDGAETAAAVEREMVRLPSPTGYLGGSVSGYGRFGPSYEHESPRSPVSGDGEGDLGLQTAMSPVQRQNQSQQRRGLLEEIMYQEVAAAQGQGDGRYSERRLSDISGYREAGYVRPAEERRPMRMGDEEYRDFFGQETGYMGYRLDSTEDLQAPGFRGSGGRCDLSDGSDRSGGSGTRGFRRGSGWV